MIACYFTGVRALLSESDHEVFGCSRYSIESCYSPKWPSLAELIRPLAALNKTQQNGFRNPDIIKQVRERANVTLHTYEYILQMYYEIHR